MATSIADEECLEAIKLLWDNTTGLYDLFGALLTGRLKAPKVQPYVTGMSEKLREAEWYAAVKKGSPYNDYRKLTLKGWGTRADVVSMATNIFNLLAWLPRDGKTLAYPSGYPQSIGFVRMMPLDDPHIEEDPTTKDGRDVWICTALFEVWTTRFLGGGS